MPLLRLFVVFATLAGLAGVSAAAPLAHAVFFTLSEDTPANRDRLVAACDKHLSNHEGTLFFSVGELADDLKRDVNDREFDVALHIVFDGRAAHDTYQDHPRHLAFIREVKPMLASVRVFDADLSEMTSRPEPAAE